MGSGANQLLGAAVASLTTDAICVVDAGTMVFADVNGAFLQTFGYTQGEATQLRLDDVCAIEAPSLVARLPELDTTGSLNAGLLGYRRKDGSMFQMATRAGVARVDGKRFYCLVLRDGSDIERAVRESEQRFRTLADAAFEGIGITEGGCIVDCNEQLGQLLGAPVSQLIGKSVADLVAPEWRAKLVERFKAGAGEPFEHVMLRFDGTSFDAESQAKTVRLGDRTVRVTALRDITKRKQMEDQLKRSQRLESVGRLAGGIAHDFNNLLTVVLSVADVLLEEPRPAQEEDDLKQLRAAGMRAAELTQQLLAFARRRIVEPKVVDLNTLVADLDKMLRRLLGEHIALVSVCGSDLGAVRVDPGQIEQVIVNLAINARDAMEQCGTLTIETANVTLGPDYTAAHPDVSPGDYVMLAVSDTGLGMEAATIEHIFEPFFTTKAERGSGLGLSTCYGIVKQSGGSISVYSEVGSGSTFKVYLPRVYAPLDGREARKATVPRRGSERLLLVEDDAMVRPVAARALRDQGYEVFEAASPSEARALFERFAGKFDALITDVILPEMNGWQLAQLLLKQNPRLRVLYTSGYTENTIVHHGVVDAGIHFLAKPYVSKDLAQRVREVLDSDEGDRKP
jgi:two-component system, cell cycle sensor histidine kinase and response regulator CckA